eukprot:1776434-Ditylum_brightwellii.AAC.1
MIVKEIGTAGYIEHTHCFFKIYLTSTDTKFLRGIKDKQKEWTLTKQSTTYIHTNLMDLALKLYNNQGAWQMEPKCKQVDQARGE